MTENRKISSAHKKLNSSQTVKIPTSSYSPHEVVEMPITLRFMKNLSWGEKCFLAEISSISDENRCCELNVKELSAIFGISQTTMHTWVKNLAEAGVIEIGKKRENGEWIQYVRVLMDFTQKPL